MTSTDTISSDASSTPSAEPSAEHVAAPIAQPASADSVAQAATPHAEAEALAAAGESASEGDSESDDDGEGEGGESEGGEATAAEGAPGAAPGDKPKKKRRRKKKRSGGGEAREARGEGAPPRPQHHRASDRAPFHTGEEVFGKVTAVLETAIMVDLSGKALAIFDRGEMEPDDLVPAVGDRFVARIHNDGLRGGLVVPTLQALREEESAQGRTSGQGRHARCQGSSPA